ncbi:MAG TPA: mechanosensitive ion channel family protein [Rhodobacteraceae bacterium]|nr:mechanosensitive ion channel family protein [Paracoccaceae bacterium]
MTFFRSFVAVLATLLALGLPAMAQDTFSAEMAQSWAATATRAEGVLENKLASTPALENLRADLTARRGEAQAVEDESRKKVEAFQAQLEALGPAPEEGTTEAPELASRRSELEATILLARVPLAVAQEAFQRLDGLISEINTLIRERFSEQLVERGPLPINPALWGTALSDVADYSGRMWREVRGNLENAASRQALAQKAPMAVFIGLIGLIILFWLRARFTRLVSLVLKAGEDASSWQLALLNLSKLVAPSLGACALIFAIYWTDVLGLRGVAILNALPMAAFALIAAPWLGRSVFGRKNNPVDMIGVSATTAGYKISLVLGIVFALSVLIDAMAAQGDFSTETRAVLFFPLIVLASLSIFRLARITRAKPPVAEDEPEPAAHSFAALLAQALFLTSISAPILAALGYYAAGRYLTFPTILTLGFLTGLLVLFDLFRAFLERWVDGQAEAGSRKDQARLIPIFVAFLMILAALPVLALIWGASRSELQNIWEWLNAGVSIGASQFSITDLLVFVLVFGVGYTITRLVQKTIRTSVLPRTKMDTGGKNAMLAGIGYVGIFLAALAAISATGLDLSGLAIVAGALSVGIGFGLQNVVSNFVSGIILLIERPIKEGDWIEAGGVEGTVRKISVRATLIDTFDRCAVIVPNSDLIAGAVKNWTAPDITGRLKVSVGVAYGTDAERVRDILTEIATAHPQALLYPAPSVVFVNFGASSLDFVVRIFLRDVNKTLSVRSDINFAIAKRFAEEDIEIPFTQNDVNLRNVGEIGEALRAALNPKADT